MFRFLLCLTVTVYNAISEHISFTGQVLLQGYKDDLKMESGTFLQFLNNRLGPLGTRYST
jgi:hypothetical protein